MREFNTQKAAFLLVALVIATQMLVVLIVVGFCTGGVIYGSLQAGSCKDLQDDIQDLFNMAFTAAIAFAGGRMSAPTFPAPKLPPEENKGE